ncbi:endonuclease YncB(thermonuclease family) [Hymenobacter luteus]|uniref:Endonuclease YncB(Thermonuclease family) n=2 Tax=Hymenobacter TaxID=89966 RepID=A0A7W9WCQ4_9BACT|nr:thermonuclease family protein [Hymenobacter latericoloratus]MBB4601970.1 endonuclease YncB(thermonuclease family) [Hymenobacter latericoloratus]MBB6059601.1 endonuclease YncB(thermonuclease family) [Hymenobacter luteus]
MRQVVRASVLAKPPAPRLTPAAARRGSGPEYGSVQRVLDGDTYEVLLPAGLVRVRLRGVDAPELSQPFGRQAADSVARLLRGRLLEADRGAPDSYGRPLTGLRVGVLMAGGSRRWLRVDSLLVARGWAWAYEPGQPTPRWAVLQQVARHTYRGLWQCGTALAVRPGVWRAYNKQEKARAWVGCPRRLRE